MADHGQRRALVGCGADKSDRPEPAKSLYTGPYFAKNRRYARNVCDDWVILSAKHHVLQPETITEPYDRTLNNMDKNARQEWSARTFEQLLRLDWEDFTAVEILAGERYWEGFKGRFGELPVDDIRFPLSGGEGMGEQMRKAEELVDEEVGTDAMEW